MSWIVNSRGCAVCTPRIPKGRPLPCTSTLRLATTPCAARSGALPKRASVARSSTTTGPVERSTNPACESASVGNTVRPTAPSRQPTPARSSSVRLSGRSSSTLANGTSSTRATMATAPAMSSSGGAPASARWPMWATASCWRAVARSCASVRDNSASRTASSCRRSLNRLVPTSNDPPGCSGVMLHEMRATTLHPATRLSIMVFTRDVCPASPPPPTGPEAMTYRDPP